MTRFKVGDKIRDTSNRNNIYCIVKEINGDRMTIEIYNEDRDHWINDHCFWGSDIWKLITPLEELLWHTF